MRELKTRDELPSLLKEIGLNGIGVELGVHEGLFSRKILEDSALTLLYSIDPWAHQPEDVYKDRANYHDEHHENNYRKSVKNLSLFNKRSAIIRDFSYNAVKNFKNDSLDFVYIDGNHSYEAVKQDISDWYSKVKPGGILAGHDYLDGIFRCGDKEYVFGVKSAVNEFTARHKLMLHVTIEPETPAWKSWYVFKSKQVYLSVYNTI
jgi:hypothetical protein